jgi:hypothetical protein
LAPLLSKRGLGGGRNSRWTNPLESPLAKEDTREGTNQIVHSFGGYGRSPDGIISSSSSVCSTADYEDEDDNEDDFQEEA